MPSDEEILSKLVEQNPDLEDLEGEVMHQELMTEVMSNMVNHLRAAEKLYTMAVDEDEALFGDAAELLLSNIHLQVEMAKANALALQALRPNPKPVTVALVRADEVDALEEINDD